MKKLEYLKNKKEIIIKIIMLSILFVIIIKIFFNDKVTFLSSLIKGHGLDYCIANMAYDKFDRYGNNISQQDIKANINKIIEDADKISYYQYGYMETYGKDVLENHYSLWYKFTYSKEQNAYELEINDYMYISDDTDNNLVKKGTYTIATIDGIEYIFVKEVDDKKVLKANENKELYDEILSFRMKPQLEKMLDNKARIKEGKSYKTAKRYIIDFDNFRSGISLYTYGKNNRVLSYNISIYNNNYNYVNDMSFTYKNTKINIPKLEDYN